MGSLLLCLPQSITKALKLLSGEVAFPLGLGLRSMNRQGVFPSRAKADTLGHRGLKGCENPAALDSQTFPLYVTLLGHLEVAMGERIMAGRFYQ